MSDMAGQAVSFLLDPDRDDDYAAELADHVRLLGDIDHDRNTTEPPVVCPEHGPYIPDWADDWQCPPCAIREAQQAAADDRYTERYGPGNVTHDR